MDEEALKEWTDINQPSLFLDTDRDAATTQIQVTANVAGLCHEIMMNSILASQHLPFGIHVNDVQWKMFLDELGQISKSIAPISNNYDRLGDLWRRRREDISLGWEVQYIPWFTKGSSELYKAYGTMFEEDPFCDEIK